MISLSVCLISTITFGGEISGGFSYAYPLANLFLMEPGFDNPALARGLVGFPGNPGGLARLEGTEVMGFLALPASSGIGDTLALILDSAGLDSLGLEFASDTLRFPYSFSGNEKWGIDYLAFGKWVGKKRDWAMGIAVTRGDFIGADLDASLSGSAVDSIVFEDTLDMGDISGLPPGTLIPVECGLEAGGDARIGVSGHGGFTTLPITAAAARRSGGWSYGAGLRITPVWGNANIDAFMTGGLAGSASLSAQPYLGDTWTISAEFSGELENDTLAKYYFQGNIATLNPALILGLTWETGWMSWGLVLERGSPASVSGDWAHGASYPYGTVDYEIVDDSLIVDTVNKVISGKGRIVIHGFGRDTLSGGGPVESLLGGVSGFKTGLGFNLWKLSLGTGGGLVSSDDGNYFRGSWSLSISTRTWVRFHLSLLAYWQAYVFGYVGPLPMIISPPPALATGLGTSFPVGGGRAYLGVRANTSSLLSALAINAIPGSVSSQKSASYVSFGGGISYPIGEK